MPQDVGALLNDALQLRRRGDVAAAQAGLSEALAAARKAGHETEALVAEAYLAILARDRHTSVSAIGRAVAHAPDSPYVEGLGMVINEQWPPPPRDCETHLCARAGRFRELCKTLPQPGESALELGAAHGLATRVLAKRCRAVHALEKSPSMAETARSAAADLPNVNVLTLSADAPGVVLAHVPRADLVFLDVGGSTPFVKTMHLARLYRELYQPRCLVLRCVYINNFVAGLASYEPTYGPSIWAPPGSDEPA